MEKENITPISNPSYKLTKLTNSYLMSGDYRIPHFTQDECHDMEIVVCFIVTPKMALDVPVQCSFKNLLC